MSGARPAAAPWQRYQKQPKSPCHHSAILGSSFCFFWVLSWLQSHFRFFFGCFGVPYISFLVIRTSVTGRFAWQRLLVSSAQEKHIPRHLRPDHAQRRDAELRRLNPSSLPMLGFFEGYPKMGVSKYRGGPPKSSIFIGVFHYKPSILGYPYFWKHPNEGMFC